MNYEHVMVDLETLGTRAGCQVLSIGAVAFNKAGLGPEYYAVLETETQAALGLTTEPSTLEWWARQSQAARRVFTDPKVDFVHGMGSFSSWLHADVASIGKIKMWGNGSDFDNSILYAAYAAAGLKVPWLFWNSRCYRTLKNLCLNIPLTRQGTYHNALDDAKSQAEHAVAMLNAGGLLN